MKKLAIQPQNTTLVNSTALMSQDAWKRNADLETMARERAEAWADSQIDSEVRTAEFLDALIAQRVKPSCKKSMGQLMAAALDTAENRRKIGVTEIKTAHLTGTKGLQLPGKGNARQTYNLCTALEVIADRGAKLDNVTAHVLLSHDSEQWSKAYLGLAASLRKNETVRLQGTLTDVIKGLAGDKALNGWLAQPSPFGALLPAPPMPIKVSETDDEEEDPENDNGPEFITPEPIPDGRSPQLPIGTRDQDAADGLHAALTALCLPLTPQGLVSLTTAIVKAGEDLSGERSTVALFVKHIIQNLPQGAKDQVSM